MRATVVLAVLAFSAAAAADDGLKVKVLKDGGQTVTVIQGCHSKTCINDLAEVSEKGPLRMRGLFSYHEQYLTRIRVVDGAVVCEKFALAPKKWSDEEIAAKGAEMLKEPCK